MLIITQLFYSQHVIENRWLLHKTLPLVKKAAKLAVYDEITINAKNHQTAAAKRVGTPLKWINSVEWMFSIQWSKCSISLRQNVATLLHNTSYSQPDAIVHVPNILQFLRIIVARMGIFPIFCSHSEMKLKQVYFNDRLNEEKMKWIYFASKNSVMEMHKNAVAMWSQTCVDKGSMKENKPAFSLCGFAYRMLMPSVINGVEKSMAVFREYVTVMSKLN